MNKVWLARVVGFTLCGALAGCAGSGIMGAGNGPVYQCEHGIAFTVRFADNTAVLSGIRTAAGNSGAADQDLLLRDAGGQGSQTFYSNPRMRAEFGLGANGREAVLRYPLLPLVARCVRDAP